MGVYTQTGRPLSVTTPLGKDVLLLTGFSGREAISELFRFRLDLLAEKQTKVSFDAIVGQEVTVELKLGGGGKRYFSGIVSRFTQAGRDETRNFTHFRAEIVPKLWLLTRKVRSRTFQHLAIPEILKKVLAGLPVKYELTGKYEPRDYCVQYAESDFAFASRLMEEEGIFYFFKHSSGSHEMTVSDQSTQHPGVPGPAAVTYSEVLGGKLDELQVHAWNKTQELRSGKYTLWDHCFELPEKHLEVEKQILSSVTAGAVTHKLQLAGNGELEIYEYPGGYAQRFDGIDKSGGEQPADLQKIFADNARTVKIRMEQEEAPSLEILGSSTCGHFVAGHQFTLQKHFDGDGAYVLTSVEHDAELANAYRSTPQEETFGYTNRFACIPTGLPYRTPRRTPRPTIAGVQTATVVGPPGEEIYCDKYGRVKVQFHWDREGKKNLDSSCWVRVAQPWAGKGWGAFFWPRIGNEVVVAFEEGDPDQPQIVGSVYNAENMPPFLLPVDRELGGIKSASVRGNAYENYNGIVFIDEKGREHLSIHSERHLSFNSELDKLFNSGRHKSERVHGISLSTIGSLPGGGSGGGPDPYDPMPPPQATGLWGLNAAMVYGENLQVATGLNHQIALGSNLQVCINPGGLAAGVTLAPGAADVSGVLGSGLGGNMQLTIGTSANFVLGREFDINLGPAKITVEAGKYHPDSVSVCKVLGIIYGLWVLAYGCTNENDERSGITCSAQIVVQILLMQLMGYEMVHKTAELGKDETVGQLFGKDIKPDDKVENFAEKFGDFPSALLILLAVIVAGIIPGVADIVTADREKKRS
jgi:type VI secretion system secreted protein VgrG